MNSLYIDPLTGGYIIVDNDIVKANSTISKINVLLKQRIDKNIYALDEGNPILSATGILSNTEIINGINYCLKSLISDGEITSLNIDKFKYSNTGKLTIDMTVILHNGLNVPLQWIK